MVSNNSKWITEKIDSNTQHKIATRAFKASERVLFGLAKKVRHKAPTRFKSVEGKTNQQGLRWKDNQVIWGSLKLKPIMAEALWEAISAKSPEFVQSELKRLAENAGGSNTGS